MPNYDKVKVSTATRDHNERFNLGGWHETTFDFGHNKVMLCKLCKPGDRLDLSLDHNIQMSPPVGATLGKCAVQFKSFFVPSRLAFRPFEDFIMNQKALINGTFRDAKLPHTYNSFVSSMFMYYTAFREPGSRILPSNEVLKPSSPWEDETTSLPLYFNPFAINKVNGFQDFILTEPIGICSGVSSEGKPINVLHYKPTYNSLENKNHLELHQWESDVESIYNGLDFDFVGQYVDNNEYGNAISFLTMAHQLEGAKYFDVNGNANTVAIVNRPYVLFRFTRLGKKIFDLFQSFELNINFCCPTFDSSNWIERVNPIVSGLASKVEETTITTPDVIYPIPNDELRRFDAVASSVGDKWLTTVYSIDTVYPTPDSVDDMDDTYFNMLKFNGLMKIYMDYLCPSYWNRDFEVLMRPYLERNDYEWLLESFMPLRFLVTATYDKDYFTASWLYPNQPTNNVPNFTLETGSNGLFKNPISNSDNDSGYVSTESGVDGTANTSILDPATTTKVALDAIQALHKLARITGLAGNRYIDQLFARFGVINKNARLQRSEMIDECRNDFDIELVLSNSDTSTASLGDYVSHGSSRGSNNLGKYEVSEWGYVYIIASIIPYASYYQGRSRENMYKNPMDFYTPELDEIDAMQSIRMDELYSDNRYPGKLRLVKDYYKPSGTFGYTRLYAEMKKGSDVLSGDFRLNSRGKYTNNAYHLFREIPSLHSLYKNGYSLVNKKEFSLGLDCSQYDRIFQLTDIDYDHFICFANVNCYVTRNCKGMSDYTFDDECESLKRTISNGGVEK